MQRRKAKQVEPMLSAAGFKMKLADTPEKLAKVKALRQLKLKPLKRHGKLYYAYADAEGCKCTYLGNESAYQNYQNLVVQQRIAKEDQAVGGFDEDATIVEDDAVWEDWAPTSGEPSPQLTARRRSGRHCRRSCPPHEVATRRSYRCGSISPVTAS
jgi:hypothetical protein